jgi:hypothetical protein
MQVEHHDLHHEFPEFLESIQTLKISSNRFARMHEEYNHLTSEVERLEEKDIPVDDFTIENMKKQRVKLKDEMYQILVQHKSAN